MKEIKDYLHLYLGCQIWSENGNPFKLCPRDLDRPTFKEGLEKPILRNLSDATPEEIKEIEDSRVFVRVTPVHQVGNMQWTPETFRLVLSKHFDLFGLIKSGLAIDLKTLK